MLTMGSGRGHYRTQALVVSICWLASAHFAAQAVPTQTPSIVFANPQVDIESQRQGVQISPSINQSANTSSIKYTVTPPANYSPPGDVIFGSINLQLLAAPNAQIPLQITVSFSGWANVLGAGFGSNFIAAGSSTPGSSPQVLNVTGEPGTGMLQFSLIPPNPNSGSFPPSSITVSFDIGNPLGGRKAYLNDFTGTGKTTNAVWRPSEGNWYLDFPLPVIKQWGLNGDVPVPGDYDADGVTDYAVWRPFDGSWHVTNTGTGAETAVDWGLAGDIPVAATDFDGDGRTDYTVWRPSDGSWYIKRIGSGPNTIKQWGLPGDIPLCADFDGDGKTDYTVWRPSNGTWYITLSSTSGTIIKQWGLPGDTPIAGDFDGDGKTDYAVWRPSNGTWYLSLSSTGQEVTKAWGLSMDVPISGDFDGDGKTDYAVWRASEGNFHVSLSSNGQEQVTHWGLPTDLVLGTTLTAAPAQ